jgi:hypothetical protein
VKLWTCILIVLAASAGAKEAPQKYDPGPVHVLLDAGSRVRADYDVLTSREATDEHIHKMVAAKEDLDSATSKFEEAATPALRSANSSQALLGAVREYYSSAQSCFESARNSSRSTQANCEKMSVAEKALLLEVHAAN